MCVSAFSPFRLPTSFLLLLLRDLWVLLPQFLVLKPYEVDAEGSVLSCEKQERYNPQLNKVQSTKLFFPLEIMIFLVAVFL